MNKFLNPTLILACSLLLQLPQAQAQENKDCCQPGREESAKEVIKQSNEFKLNATQSTIQLKDAIKRARMLKGETNRLAGELEKGNVDEYKKNLAAFIDHAEKYKMHLAKTEKDLGHCKASEDAYKAQLNSWKAHIDTYHVRVPNMGDLRPPHVCPGMNISVGESNHLANSMRTDTQNLLQSQKELAAAEARLSTAMQRNTAADAQVANRAKLREAEQQLAGEFASLKTELELLNTQYKAIAKTSDPRGTVAISRVNAQVKSQENSKDKPQDKH